MDTAHVRMKTFSLPKQLSRLGELVNNLWWSWHPEAARLFNAKLYFEAHDTFEEIWMDERGEDVRFYQGLVQLATGFYHLKMDNLKGAESQLNKGFAKLEKYKPRYRSLELTELLNQVAACIDSIQNNQSDDSFCTQSEAKIPKMQQGVSETIE